MTDLWLDVLRTVTYVGYVLLAGTLAFWILVWPGGTRDRRLTGLAVGGIGLMLLGTLADPLVRLTAGGQALGDFLGATSGTALLVRLAALSAAAFFLPDLVRGRIAGWRQGFAFAVVVVLAVSLVVRSEDPDGRWASVEAAASSGHVLAAAAWLGGIVALAVLLVGREDVHRLDVVAPLFARVATVSAGVLLVTGAVQALVVAGSLGSLVTSSYGLLVVLKTLVLLLLLRVGHHGRRHAVRTAGAPPSEGDASVRQHHAPLLVVAVELALALAALVATTALVAVSPR